MKYFLLVFFSSFVCFSQTNDSLSQFIDLEEYANNFTYDIRYATSNNFLEEPIYECEKCLLLPEAAEALAKANNYFCDLPRIIRILRFQE